MNVSSAPSAAITPQVQSATARPPGAPPRPADGNGDPNGPQAAQTASGSSATALGKNLNITA
jgi:hypothetical protein